MTDLVALNEGEDARILEVSENLKRLYLRGGVKQRIK
jgi:hypothetical protein